MTETQRKENPGKKSAWGEILRFAIAGGVCFLIEFAVLVLLKEKLGLDTLIAAPIAFAVSVAVNYLLCMAWVFKGTKDAGTAAKAGFLITSLIGLLLNELLMLLFRLIFGEEAVLMTLGQTRVSMYMVNKCLATLLVMIWNFFTKKAVLTSGWVRRMTERFGKGK